MFSGRLHLDDDVTVNGCCFVTSKVNQFFGLPQCLGAVHKSCKYCNRLWAQDTDRKKQNSTAWKIRYPKKLYIIFTVTGITAIMIWSLNLHKPIRCPEIPYLSSTAYRDIDIVDKKNGSVIEKRVEGTSEQVKKRSISTVETTERSCQPHTHIFFLKTHKTASSTIVNILFRFGESHNLTFALPILNYPQFFYPYYFMGYFVEGFITRIRPNYDIMCHHMRFQLTEVEKVMPKDTFYFTIMRNPVSVMESSFSYYKALDIFAKAYSLEEYLKNPHKYYNQTSKSSSFGKNLIAFDLGLDHNVPESQKYFEMAQKSIEIMFNLVLITEYFDESLILLKDALCWSFDDVLSFPLNSRNNTNQKNLSEETQEKIIMWNQLDWQLYVYFNKTFWKKVDNFGRDRMQSEVQELRKRRTAQSEICLQGQVDSNKIEDTFLRPYQAGLSKILGYNLKPRLKKAERLLCRQLVTPELQYTELLSKKQNQDAPMKATKTKYK
ncbi:galactose-3-O-sulfotransferase 2-like [Bufo gargarizans]|uniref:galactose-3-O-sulfotransferase 2-like n=1 Tax=Bufo gargarizans TaxID=30331 RepID=UPI001CF0EBC8|nr:galactose-3-O-sulfotransferase 2-like [Bufo gargarizans]